jgi:hypothetical protein
MHVIRQSILSSVFSIITLIHHFPPYVQAT